MKIAVLSDTHGNITAFREVVADVERWEPDIVIINGDIINRGPSNLACWALAKEKEASAGWHLLRGNHEEFVLKASRPDEPDNPFERDLRRFSDWTYTQVEPHQIEISQLPDRWSFTAPDESVMMVTHGSFAGNRIGVYPFSEDEDLRKILAPQPDVFVTAHTHRALIRQLDHTLVVNVGSAGLPFDGDWRVSYGQFTWTASSGWNGELRRLEYDRAAAERDIKESGFIPQAGPFAKLVLGELRISEGLLHRWHHAFDERCRSGELDMETAVAMFIEENDLTDILTDVI